MLTNGYYLNLWIHPIRVPNFVIPVIDYKDYKFQFSVKGEMWEFTVTTDYFMEMLTSDNTILRSILFRHNFHCCTLQKSPV